MYRTAVSAPSKVVASVFRTRISQVQIRNMTDHKGQLGEVAGQAGQAKDTNPQVNPPTLEEMH
jgi:hypothetical protein